MFLFLNIIIDFFFQGTVKCPKCCLEHLLPQEGVVGFPNNFTLVSLVGLLDNHTEDDKESCEEEGEEKSKSNVSLCTEHRVELTLYCKNCSKAICCLCLNDKDHNYHKTSPIEDARKDINDEMISLVAEVEMEAIKLQENLEQIDQDCEADAAVMFTCRDNVESFFDSYSTKIHAKVDKLQRKLSQANEHQDVLLSKLEKLSQSQSKLRKADRDSVKQSMQQINKTLATATQLIKSKDSVDVVCKSQHILKQLKEDADFNKMKLDCTRPTPQLSFCGNDNPLLTDLIDPSNIVVDGLKKVKVGLNTFTITFVSPLSCKTPRITVRVTLPNGKHSDPDEVKLVSVGENIWQVSFYISAASFPLSGFFSSHIVSVSVRVCEIDIEGSPFRVPCEKLFGKDLITDFSL